MINLKETISGFAKLDFQGILLNGEFVPAKDMDNILIGVDDVFVPLFSNQINQSKLTSQIKLQSVQNYTKQGGKLNSNK